MGLAAASLQHILSLQEMRLYYKFQDVDIDRYVIDGQTKQVMIAAREMDV